MTLFEQKVMILVLLYNYISTYIFSFQFYLMNWLKEFFPGPRNLLWILQLAVLKIDSRMRDISKRQIVSHWIDGKRWTKNKYWDGQKGHSRPKYRFAVHLCTMVKDGVKKYPTIIYKDFFIVLHKYNPLLNINHN